MSRKKGQARKAVAGVNISSLSSVLLFSLRQGRSGMCGHYSDGRDETECPVKAGRKPNPEMAFHSCWRIIAYNW